MGYYMERYGWDGVLHGEVWLGWGITWRGMARMGYYMERYG